MKLYAHAACEFPSTNFDEDGKPDVTGAPDRRAGTKYTPGDEVPADMPGLAGLKRSGAVSTKQYEPPDTTLEDAERELKAAQAKVAQVKKEAGS